jgi:hypothetical protein
MKQTYTKTEQIAAFLADHRKSGRPDTLPDGESYIEFTKYGINEDVIRYDVKTKKISKVEQDDTTNKENWEQLIVHIQGPLSDDELFELAQSVVPEMTYGKFRCMIHYAQKIGYLAE